MTRTIQVRVGLAILIVVSLAWFFRYQVTPVSPNGQYSVLDRWTGGTKVCNILECFSP